LSDVAKRTGRTGNWASRSPRSGGSLEFTPDYSYVRADLKRIGFLAGTFLVLLFVLSFLLN
jgi:hypothetical protein